MIRLLRPQWQQLFCCSGGCVCNAAHGGSDGLAPVQQQKLLLTPKDSRPSAITRHAATASDAGSMPSRSFAFLSLRRHQELENVKQGSSCRASADRAASAACPAPIPVPSKTETTGQGILSMPRQCLDKVLLHLLWQTCAQNPNRRHTVAHYVLASSSSRRTNCAKAAAAWGLRAKFRTESHGAEPQTRLLLRSERLLSTERSSERSVFAVSLPDHTVEKSTFCAVNDSAMSATSTTQIMETI